MVEALKLKPEQINKIELREARLLFEGVKGKKSDHIVYRGCGDGSCAQSCAGGCGRDCSAYFSECLVKL